MQHHEYSNSRFGSLILYKMTCCTLQMFNGRIQIFLCINKAAMGNDKVDKLKCEHLQSRV